MSFKRNRNFQVNDSVVNDSSGNGNTFSTHVGDNYHQHFSRTESNLSSRVAFNALHDAEARYPQPNILAGTREEIIGKLTHWCEDDSKSSRVYWVNGAAGVGKSAIAQALCEKYTQTGKLAAAFFFSRNDSSRDKLDPFVATIAHQLATCKAFKSLITPLIEHVIHSTPGILHKNLEDQFKMLIQEPCAQVDPRNWAQLPRLVILDGVDECIDVNSQKRLLQMIQNATPTLPLDFLILSRPESHISDTFSLESFTPSPSRLALGDFTESVRADIKRYLCHEFARIRQEHRRTLDSSLQASWPGDSVIDQLVSKATGQFMFARTTTTYIDTGKAPATPVLRLDIILHAKRVVNSSSPYPDLDLLYSQILKYCGYEGRKLREILRLIVSPFDKVKILESPFRLHDSPPVLQSLWALEKLLEMSQGEAAALLSGLHSILAIPTSKTENIVVLHASFSEFLLDKQRAGVYYVGSKLSSQEWFQLLIPCQIRMLSRYCVEDNHWSTQSPKIHGQPIDGVDDGDLGSLNVWKCLYESFTSIAVNKQITAALNVFDPHLYLTAIIHWGYKLLSAGWGRPPIFKVNKGFEAYTYDQNYIVSVEMQIRMFHDAYRMLLKISDNRSRSSLQDFFIRCKSFFRGFYVSFPSHISGAVKYMLVICHLAISSSRDAYPLIGAAEPIMFRYPDRKWMIRVLPSNSGVAIPSRWEVKYIDPTEGELLRKLLPLPRFDLSINSQSIMEALGSTEIERWTYEIARLDWETTWITYLLGKLAGSIPGKWVMSLKVVLEEDDSEDEHDSENQKLPERRSTRLRRIP
ncbi:hypothetical protein E1B28_009331 [Marasmius oreades]|uniref:Nephrocystin 3-like N-terminal domain-containing protein n=1 Tax=Marasmius oreades TaxID=181124 RepID=A0A9P7S0U9_9AGAR|nr:uncharacterized protein E1B28_009331 [Marasmius oreades]KAG7093037.1 hypothetical protein E1B28_009331 [Marasmius oreades]